MLERQHEELGGKHKREDNPEKAAVIHLPAGLDFFYTQHVTILGRKTRLFSWKLFVCCCCFLSQRELEELGTKT